MYTVPLYSMLAAAAYYVGSRAKITSWLWSRYPSGLAAFMDCAACSGAWYGLIISLTVGRHFELRYAGLSPYDWMTHFVVMASSIVTTPITAGLMQWGLDHVGTAVEIAIDDDGAR